MRELGRVWDRKSHPTRNQGKHGFPCLRILHPLFLLLLVGCGTVKNREPEWVRNPKTVYPENRFLVAIGEGDTRRAAENAAAGNLSRIFESHIESDERMIDKVQETGRAFSRETGLTTDINILSSQTLINIQHAEAWQDDHGRYHAVAYLNRRETATIYRDRIEEQSGHIQALMEDASQTDDPLRKYARYRAASHAAHDNDLLLHQLKVIYPASATASSPPYSIHEIQKAAGESAKKIRVGIDIKGDTDGRITACLEELTTRYGFVVGKPASLEMMGRISITDTGKRTAGLAFFRYTLFVPVSDANGNVLTTINAQGREAVATPDEARTRCYRTLENAIQRRGAQQLDTYFNSLTSKESP